MAIDYKYIFYLWFFNKSLYVLLPNNKRENWFANKHIIAYLGHTKLLSTQQHSLRHTDQSRDYRLRCLYNVRNTAVYIPDRTSLHHILYV